MEEIKQTTTLSQQQLKDIITAKTHVYCLVPGTSELMIPIDGEEFWFNVLDNPTYRKRVNLFEVIHHPVSDQVYIYAANIRTEETQAETLGRVLFRG